MVSCIQWKTGFGSQTSQQNDGVQSDWLAQVSPLKNTAIYGFECLEPHLSPDSPGFE